MLLFCFQPFVRTAAGFAFGASVCGPVAAPLLASQVIRISIAGISHLAGSQILSACGWATYANLSRGS